MNVFDFEVQDQDSSKVSLSQYAGKVLLIVNTATGCGFTPHYKELQAMYDDLKNYGFEILDFPCNQFGNQAPGSDAEINEFCEIKYATTFPRFAKIDVNGEMASPLFVELDRIAPFTGFGISPQGIALSAAAPLKKGEPGIRWNFTKFLVDETGNVIERFEPTVSMKKVRAAVEKLLAK